MADRHVFLAPNADRSISRPRLVRTSSLPDLSKVHTDSILVVVDRISNENMSTSVPDYGSLSSPCEMSEMAAIKNALNGRSINSLKVEDLRDELEKRKLPKSGRKTELVKRIKESILTGFGEIQIRSDNFIRRACENFSLHLSPNKFKTRTASGGGSFASGQRGPICFTDSILQKYDFPGLCCRRCS